MKLQRSPDLQDTQTASKSSGTGIDRAFFAATAARLETIRSSNLRIHCITNSVAQQLTANALLSIGAIPSLTIDPAEVGDFAGSASALLVNLGTHDPARARAIEIATTVVRDKGIPWVLDPVFADRSRTRRSRALAALNRRPTALRANEVELKALRKSSGIDTAQALSERFACAIGQTGAVDQVIAGQKRIDLSNGHPLMSMVTATGCALSALVAAFLCTEGSNAEKTASALLCWSVAGEMAAKLASGPGSFPAHLLDALHKLDEPGLVRFGRVHIY